MRILLISQYFWPETFIVNDLAKKLVSKGHVVTVATGKPNYPDGDIYSGYHAKGIQSETYSDTIEVLRVPIHPRGKGGAKNLILNYLSFVLMGLWHFPRMLKGREIDVIIVFAPSPITQVIPAIFLKWIKRAHLAVWVQDLWPESLSATGFVKNSVALRLVGLMVRGIYHFCDTLLLQSHAFFAPVRKYSSADKLVYFPNSIDTSSDEVTSTIPVELQHELESNFSVVFAGNLGTAQSLESVVDAAKLLKGEPGLRVILVGSGSMAKWVTEQKILYHLDNLTLAGRFPMNAMSEIYSRSSALLVSLKDEEIFSYTVPSKVQAYLAAGRPIIASLRGEGARVIDESGSGMTCIPGDGRALADAILAMKSLSHDQRQAMGTAGRDYFNENYDMDNQTNRLIEILNSRIGI
ncbi:glycosyltransferase family 4 protein [Pseudomonas kitaguniensis]|uniref:glycosyltransferase family 4 protein n=1 Tax=Pseudomonas kitaguniensis TaxID=2607908 RepID=UPI003CFC5607